MERKSGTEPVAPATGFFIEITRLLAQAVPYQIDPSRADLEFLGKAGFAFHFNSSSLSTTARDTRRTVP